VHAFSHSLPTGERVLEHLRIHVHVSHLAARTRTTVSSVDANLAQLVNAIGAIFTAALAGGAAMTLVLTAVADRLGGHVAMLFTGAPVTMSHIKSGRLKVLAVTDSQRSAALPDTPTMGESVPGYEFNNWYGIMAPPKLPKALVTRIHAELIKVLNEPATNKRLVGLGSTPVGSDPETFRRFLLSDVAKWADVVKKSGAKAE